MKPNDPKGYYSRLGLSSNSSATEIKAAYRRLAKQLHPDHNPDVDAKARFQALNEAFQVLSDPESRASYDNLQANARQSEESHAEIEPVSCSKCGKITAQPRYLIFWYVVSAVLFTRRQAFQGIYCVKCARADAFRASAISAAVGWWGFPWGPIYTISDIWRNAFGGEESLGAREWLEWRNTLYFATHGNGELAYALARTLRAAKNEDIASDAVRLMDMLKVNGVNPNAARLKPAWRRSPLEIVVQLAFAAVVPAALAWLVASTPTQPAWQTMSDAPTQSETQPSSTGNMTEQQFEQRYMPSSTSAQAAAPICATPPENGAVLEGGSPNASGELNALTIENGSSGNAIVKVRDASTNAVVVSFFVDENNTASYSNIPDGSYIIQYAFGDQLNDTCTSFAHMKGAARDPDVETFATQYEGTSYSHQELSLKLYGVLNGNMAPQSIDEATFNAK